MTTAIEILSIGEDVNHLYTLRTEMRIAPYFVKPYAYVC